ncbi:MAG: hypothetical protein EBU70_11805 [Actinobacteria bacterium]|nr:hypothetical protein [Actinomycetota bacterium]
MTAPESGGTVVMSTSRSAPANRDSTAPVSRRGVAVGATAVILVIACLGTVAWYAGWFRRPEDPRVVAIGDLMRDLLEKERRRTGPATFMTAIERVSGIVTVASHLQPHDVSGLRRHDEQRVGTDRRDRRGPRADGPLIDGTARRAVDERDRVAGGVRRHDPAGADERQVER